MPLWLEVSLYEARARVVEVLPRTCWLIVKKRIRRLISGGVDMTDIEYAGNVEVQNFKCMKYNTKGSLKVLL